MKIYYAGVDFAENTKSVVVKVSTNAESINSVDEKLSASYQSSKSVNEKVSASAESCKSTDGRVSASAEPKNLFEVHFRQEPNTSNIQEHLKYTILLTKNTCIMTIKKLKAEKLRNEEHFQFQTEFNELVNRFTAQALGIERAYAAYQTHYANEGEALDVVQKSALTSEIVDADDERDNLFRGLDDTVEGACNHYDPVKKEAALRLKIVFDHFGNISKKSHDEQTAAGNALTNDLATKYAAEVATLGLADWLMAFDTANKKFASLAAERYSADSGKTPLKMKEVRIEVDGAYRTITNLIDALVLVNGPDGYTSFIEELNERVEKYNNKLAQRQGRNNKKEEE